MIAAGVAALLGLMSLVTSGSAVSSFLDGLTNPDRLVRWSTAIAPASGAAIPVTFVDVDAESMDRFGNPAVTPRDMLAAIASSARDARAAGLFLDFDFALGRDEPRGQAALLALINLYPLDAPPLFLVSSSSADAAVGRGALAGAEQYGAIAAAVGERARAGAPIRLVVARAKADEDLVVRRWVLWETRCNPTPLTTSSPQLYAAAIAAHGLKAGLARVDALLETETDRTCRKVARPDPVWPRNPEVEARIPFRLLAADRSFGRDVIERGGEAIPLIRRVVAHTLVRAGAEPGAAMRARAVSEDLFAGRFVIIGATDQPADRFLTPLGVLAGSVIVANNIIGAPAILETRPVGAFEIAVLALLVFIPAFTVLKWLRPIPAVMGIGVMALGAIALFGRSYSPAVAFEVVSYALAMLGIAGTVEALAEFGLAIRDHGWSAVLRKPPTRAAAAALPSPAPDIPVAEPPTPIKDASQP